MKLLPALVVGLTAGFLAVQDLKGEKKEPVKKATLRAWGHDLIDPANPL